MTTRLHGIVWRWHFLAGLAACPILVITALTGALYVFQDELERAIKPEIFDVAPGERRQSADALLAAAPCKAASIVLDPDPTKSAIVWCEMVDGVQQRWGIDPYRAKPLDGDAWETSPFGIIFNLHWNLMLGDRGRLVVEWGTSWAMLLMISGAYLWWPRGRKNGTWWPRRLGGRQRMRDLHAIAGAYALPILLAISATGLCWTLLAGEKRWEPIADDAAHEAWHAPPRSKVLKTPRIGAEAALVAAGLGAPDQARVRYVQLPNAPDDPYVVYAYSVSHADPSAAASIWIDAYSGTKLNSVEWKDLSTMGSVSNTLYAIHVGSIAGLPGRIAALIAALILAGLCITGPWMWWMRRPRGKLGVPPAPARSPWPLYALLAVLGWLLPTVGYSLLAVLALESAAWATRRWRARRSA